MLILLPGIILNLKFISSSGIPEELINFTNALFLSNKNFTLKKKKKKKLYSFFKYKA